MKVKRKDIEDVYDDFSDFSLSSPACKIRRLDAELPPIIEETETNGSSVDLDLELELQEEPSIPVNEERALVLYKPVNSSVSPNVSVTVNPHLIPGFKNGVFWSGPHHLLKSSEDELAPENKNGGSNNCLAVVPWVSNPLSTAQAQPVGTSVQVESSEPMEAEDAECGAMDIEEYFSFRGGVDQSGTTDGSEGVLRQWQQQHCMTPQIPPNTAATPIMWSL